jgi:hypothetical protein
MQSGFGRASPAAGAAVLKVVGPRLTWLADASYRHFVEHRYDFTRHRFGGETRVNTALAYRAYTDGDQRVDLVGELLGLHLGRDRGAEDKAGELQALEASGGAILYAAAGLRYTAGPVSAAVGVRRAALTRLNEESDQQGSEGLERFRATFALSFSTGL